MGKLKLQTTTLKSGAGFTLVEVLVALFILITGVVAGLSTINSGLASTQVAKSKLIAANLTQEGIEIVRNIRDNNWLEQRINPGLLWDNGFSSGDWEAIYQSQNVEPYQGRYLKIDINSFYNYTSGSDTKFKRKITIQKITDDQLRVISKVEWQEKGKSYNLTAVGDLYNWLRGSAGEPSSPPPSCYADGTACSSPSQCCSGYCVNGVCCNTDCAAVCKTCDGSGNCVNVSECENCYGCTGSCHWCHSGACYSCGWDFYQTANTQPWGNQVRCKPSFAGSIGYGYQGGNSCDGTFSDSVRGNMGQWNSNWRCACQ